MIAGDRIRIRDLGSRNGTTTNTVDVIEALVTGGTLLTVGGTQLRIDVGDGMPLVEIPSSSRGSFGAVVGASARMRELFLQLERISTSDVTVLIEGETGTGKEGVAEAIHDASNRAAARFVVIDCSAIPANLLESELFGHEVGAFTGATTRRIGAFEEASGGTLFLDEIGELPLELQPKLLRALEARTIRRVGGHETIECDLRIIAATNRDLRAEVNRGTFRPDVYYRVAVARVVLPPLRERRDDIPLLVETLLGRLGVPPHVRERMMAPSFLAELVAAPWPGNVRELRNHLEQCVVFGECRSPNTLSPAHPSTVIDPTLPYEVARRQAIEAFESAFVRALLENHAGNVAAAARSAGVNRGYLHQLLRRHGLR